MKDGIENLKKFYELSSQQIDDVVNPLEVAALFEKEHVDRGAYAFLLYWNC